MGSSMSYRRRDNHPPPPPPPPHYYSNPPPHNEYTYTPIPQPPPQPPPPPQPQPLPYGQYGQYGGYPNQYYPQQSLPFYAGYHHHPRFVQPAPVPLLTPPVYVEHQNAKKVRNDVNVHKDTVRLQVDDRNPDQHLVSFVFDAVFDGSFSIMFFGKEESNCTMVPHLPEAYPPTKVPFQKGTAQKFLQPAGTGTDLGFFALDDLSKPSPEEVYPFVISAEIAIPSSVSEDPVVNKQITLAGLEKTNDGSLKVKVMKQILWIEGARIEVCDLYGNENLSTQGNAVSGLEDSGGKECVICLTEPKNTAVMPCRHLCLCSDCAKELRFQTFKCPICREPIGELIEIKVVSTNEQQ